MVVKEDGKTPNVDTPEAKKGLDFLVNGFKQGYIPKEAIGFKETESLNAFQTGKLLFMRQWPYARGHPQHRRRTRGQGQVRHRAAAGLRPTKPGRVQPRWAQLGDERLLQAQGDRDSTS